MRSLPGRCMALGVLFLFALFDFSPELWAAVDCGSGPGQVKDEAVCVGRTPESLAGADEDYFRDMDYGATKDPGAVAAELQPYVPGITPDQAVKAAAIGRNNWIVWTAGNDPLWNFLAYQSLGGLDL